MRKWSLMIAIFFFSITAYSQTATNIENSSFRYDLEGLYPKYVVVGVDSMTQSELFEKTINWIKETYKNPDEVIKTTIANEKVRFVGFQDGVIETKVLGLPYIYGVTYTIEIEFQDGKYRIIPGNCEYRIPASQYGPAQNVVVDWNSGLQWYNKGEVRKMFKNVPSNLENFLNNLNDNLFSYLTSKGDTKKKDW